VRDLYHNDNADNSEDDTDTTTPPFAILVFTTVRLQFYTANTDLSFEEGTKAILLYVHAITSLLIIVSALDKINQLKLKVIPKQDLTYTNKPSDIDIQQMIDFREENRNALIKNCETISSLIANPILLEPG
jgi:hypothetical protein